MFTVNTFNNNIKNGINELMKQQILKEQQQHTSKTFCSVDSSTGVISEGCCFKVVLKFNDWCACDPVLQPDLDQLHLHEKPLVCYRPRGHSRMSTKTTTGLLCPLYFEHLFIQLPLAVTSRTLPVLQNQAPLGPLPPSCLLVWVEHILEPLDYTSFPLRHRKSHSHYKHRFYRLAINSQSYNLMNGCTVRESGKLLRGPLAPHCVNGFVLITLYWKMVWRKDT